METEMGSEGFAGKAVARLVNGSADLEKIARDNGIDPEAYPIVGFTFYAGKGRFVVDIICNDVARSDGQRFTVTKEASYTNEEFFELFGNFSVTVLSNSVI
jgi:hypothetical protein